MSVKTRAQLRLSAVTTMNAADVLKRVKLAAERVKGGGASLLTTGLQNVGAQVNVERESDTRLGLSITSGRRLIELCTFTAAVTSDGDGRTHLTVGGLETWRTSQSSLYFIPVGPKMIAGYAPYKRFLDEVAVELRAGDSAVDVVVR